MGTKKQGRKSRKMKTRKMKTRKIKRGRSYLAKKSKKSIGGTTNSKKKAEVKAAVRKSLIKYLTTTKPSKLNLPKTKKYIENIYKN